MVREINILVQAAFRCFELYMEMNTDIQFLPFILPLFQSHQVCKISMKFTSLTSAGAILTKEYILLDNT